MAVLQDVLDQLKTDISAITNFAIVHERPIEFDEAKPLPAAAIWPMREDSSGGIDGSKQFTADIAIMVVGTMDSTDTTGRLTTLKKVIEDKLDGDLSLAGKVRLADGRHWDFLYQLGQGREGLRAAAVLTLGVEYRTTRAAN